ncbi:MAG TPA: glycosyltransferase family 9 protein [Steroidobacteraceae bacterium]|nr:glycosyltransferase family 9 protein [Steroidobacteraceae bacterium]
MPHRFDSPPPLVRSPERVCLLRLSAIGDTCHAAAALAALKEAWPHTRFTWIIGKLEAKLMSAILPEVEFIIFDKRATSRELLRLRKILAGRRFDLLLNLQLSIRASLVSCLVSAPVKLGFDRKRARELQWLFTNAQIAPATSEHVLDSFLGFVRACGIDPGPASWRIALPASALDYADRLIPDARPTLVISPCSSHAARNWPAERYAAVADHAVRIHHMRVILAGGRSALEQRMGADIVAASKAPLCNQIGKDTLPELLGLLSKATVLISPDSGPVHMATMVGLPVIGLYAATRTARAGPYYSRRWCVDRYDQASHAVFGKPATDIPWTKKIERPGVMDLIHVADVTDQLDALMAPAKIR